jgi:hypothetical protein
MNYWEDDKHRIQADIALRIGKIALQYSKLDLPPDQDFTDTLHLCLLQNLLTNCKELVEAMARDNGEELGLKVPLSQMPDWGLMPEVVSEDSFEGTSTIEELLVHLRNAMSHPTGTNLDARFPSTGYNTLPDTSRMIRAIVFCDSPDTNDNCPLNWQNRQYAIDYLTRVQRPSRRCPWNTVPSDVQIAQAGYNGFGMFRFGKPYARVFVVVLTTHQLRSLIIGLSNLLAQPAREYWDGKSITNLIAA